MIFLIPNPVNPQRSGKVFGLKSTFDVFRTEHTTDHKECYGSFSDYCDQKNFDIKHCISVQGTHQEDAVPGHSFL